MANSRRDAAFRIVEPDMIPDSYQAATVAELLDDGDLEMVQDGNHGGNYPKPDEFSTEGIPLITGADIANGQIDLKNCSFLKPESAAKLRIGFAKPGDVLLSHKGTMGKTAIVPETSFPYIILNPQLTLYRVRDGGRLDRRFLKYFFDSRLFQDFLNRISSISTISTLSLTVQKSLELFFPVVSQQRAIARILGALDDKIELNRRMNETLEGMARALFKSWFVDFDPVRAKLDGRPPKNLDPTTAALFPDHFEHSNGELMPSGWKTEFASTLFDVRDGTHDSPKKTDHGFPLITSKHITGGTLDIGNAYLISEEDYIEINKRSKVDRLDTLMTMIGTVGVPFLVHDWKPSYAIKNIALFKTSTAPAFAHFFYLWLRSPEMQRFLASRHAGTTQSFLSLGTLRCLPVLVPNESVLAVFDGICRPMFEAIAANQIQSANLAALRDALLPKLLSGEIRIPTAEKIVEEVT